MSFPPPRCWPLLWLLLAGCATTSSVKLERYEFNRPQMGVPFRIVLHAAGRERAAAAAEAAFQRVARLNDLLSDYDTDSELSRLSRTSGGGAVVKVSEDLWRVLERAQRVAGQSDGAFDITVGPCVSLWRKARREHKMPDPLRLAEALQAVGWRKLRLDARRRTAQLLVPGMKLDLGGIAKGYAVDEALKVLRQHGITRALVAGAGDLAVGEPPPGRPGWRIELAPLDVTNAPPAKFVLLKNAALATSGDVFQHLEFEGRRYSHIVDPRTGIGLTDHSLVVMIAGDCMTADSLSKVVSVRGPEAGLALIARQPGVEARIVRLPDNQIEMRETAGFKKFYTEPEPRPAN